MVNEMYLYEPLWNSVIYLVLLSITVADSKSISIEISHQETFVAEEFKEQEVIPTVEVVAGAKRHVIRIGKDPAADFYIPPEVFSYLTSRREDKTYENGNGNETSTPSPISNSTIDANNVTKETSTPSSISNSTIDANNVTKETSTPSSISNSTIDANNVTKETSTPSSISNSTIDVNNVTKETSTPSSISNSTIEANNVTKETSTPSSISNSTIEANNITKETLTPSSISNSTHEANSNKSMSMLLSVISQGYQTNVTSLNTDLWNTLITNRRRRHKRQVGLDINSIANEGWANKHTTPAVNTSSSKETDGFQVITDADRASGKNAQVKNILIFTGSTLLTVLMFTAIAFCFLRDPKSCIVAFGTGCPCLLVVFPCIMKCLDKYLNPGRMVKENINTYLPGVIINEDGTVEKYDASPEEIECMTEIIGEIMEM
ncbi:uncharacterized protein [Argopecten irradians]|uniref:uncharacterized protein isoform X2 n=1 Tax=Argopecten irradians TaxID=31199 RepID=UPI00371923FA